MTVEYRNVLSVAAACNKLGHVFLIDGVPYDWEVSKKGSSSPERARKFIVKKIAYYRPEFVITELIGAESKKGAYSRTLINEICKAAQSADVKWGLVARQQKYQNKYEEAQALAKRFPELQPLMPKKRRWWEAEGQRIIVFEALAIGLSVMEENAGGTS